MPKNLIRREPYSRLLNSLRDDDRIKILTGVRQSGKSSLLEILKEDLFEDGIGPDQIAYINFELYRYQKWTADDLYQLPTT